LICPKCRSAVCQRSRRRGAYERLISVMGFLPWRCQTCERRFFAGLVPLRYLGRVHCPNCGNLDVEHVRRDRVVGGMWVTVQRVLRLPAYRCDACRNRFFSLRSYRPVEPSVWPDYVLPAAHEQAPAPSPAGSAAPEEPASERGEQLDDPARDGLS
jgi:hypothetical protein